MAHCLNIGEYSAISVCCFSGMSDRASNPVAVPPHPLSPHPPRACLDCTLGLGPCSASSKRKRQRRKWRNDVYVLWPCGIFRNIRNIEGLYGILLGIYIPTTHSDDPSSRYNARSANNYPPKTIHSSHFSYTLQE